jgi:CRP-like cAMP-binding protein
MSSSKVSRSQLATTAGVSARTVAVRGMFSVTKTGPGPRALLRPGDYFGEVALAMHIPRTATVRALTPAVVASCDRETFDELIRPLFADD